MKNNMVDLSLDNAAAAGGNVLERLLAANMDVNALRTNGLLQDREWKEMDDVVIKTTRQRLVAVGDLITKGLRKQLTNAMGTMVYEWETMDHMEGAGISMDGMSDTDNEHVNFGLDSVPLPLVHKNFQIGIRALAASRGRGESLDTIQIAQASQIVAETNETILFKGIENFSYGSGKVYGYTTAPNRSLFTITKSWKDATKTGAEMLKDVQDMLTLAASKRFYGPFTLYVPATDSYHLDDDYKANGDTTVRERILKLNGVANIVISDFLPTDNLVLVQLTSDVIDIIEGFQPRVIEWQSGGGLMSKFKVMSMLVPRIKSDYAGRCGVVHGKV